MNAKTTVTLGGIDFRDFEVPESLPWGGTQAFKSHILIGGRKTVHAMGPVERALAWSGRFRGPDADDRADALDAMRKAGKPVSLTWGRRSYTVLVVDFAPDSRGNNETPYSITCEVVTDDAKPNTGASDISPTEMVSGDALSAVGAAGGASGGFSLSGVQGAISAVRDFGAATSQVIGTVRRTVVAAESVVLSGIEAAESVVEGVGAIGGVIPGVHGSALVSGLRRQLTALTDMSALNDAAGYLGRMDKNLDAIGSAGAHVIVAGADLYRIAAQAYGDASEWATIANANGLTDPILPGLQELTIPPTSGRTGGVVG